MATQHSSEPLYRGQIRKSCDEFTQPSQIASPGGGLAIARRPTALIPRGSLRVSKLCSRKTLPNPPAQDFLVQKLPTLTCCVFSSRHGKRTNNLLQAPFSSPLNADYSRETLSRVAACDPRHSCSFQPMPLPETLGVLEKVFHPDVVRLGHQCHGYAFSQGTITTSNYTPRTATSCKRAQTGLTLALCPNPHHIPTSTFTHRPTITRSCPTLRPMAWPLMANGGAPSNTIFRP